MKFTKSEARRIKCQSLYWLRVIQRCTLIASEAGPYNADALGCSDKKMIEIEAKVTIVDFKNDFRKPKHHLYGGNTMYTFESQWIPTHFYFAMPERLIPKAQEILEAMERAPRAKDYGLIALEGWRVVKRARWLHERPPTDRVKTTLALRMGSELIRFHEAHL